MKLNQDEEVGVAVLSADKKEERLNMDLINLPLNVIIVTN